MSPALAIALATLFLVPVPAAAQVPLTLQEALLRAKPAVALVVSEVGGDVSVRCAPGAAPTTVTPPPLRQTGTGWFVSPSGWLLTNAHVVSPAYRPSTSVVRQRTAQAIRQACGDGVAGATATATPEPSLTVMLANGVKLPATVAKYTPPVVGEEMSGQDLALLRVEASDMPTLHLGDSAALQIGDRIHIVGFPSVVLTHELLNASAKMEASITSGAVSGFRQDRANQPIIQTDAAAAAGNSGGPALDESGDVIGVLTFVAPGEDTEQTAVQGFNFIIPSAAVTAFVQGTPVPRDAPGRFDVAWQAGLHQYFLGNHRRARAYLTEANRLLPELPDVRRVATDNDQQLAREPWLPWRSIALALLAACALAYAALFVRHIRRNRFRIPPSEVAQLVDSAEPPVILDVRDDATYAKSPVKIPRSLHAPLEGLRREDIPSDANRTVIAYCT